MNNQFADFLATPEQISQDQSLATEVLQYYTPFLYHSVISEFLTELIETGGHNRGGYNTMELVGDFMIFCRLAEPLGPYEVAILALGTYLGGIEVDCIGSDEEIDYVVDIDGRYIHDHLSGEEDMMNAVATIVETVYKNAKSNPIVM